jgi:hypothetical protein
MRLPGRLSNRRRRHQPQSPPAGRIAVVLDQGAAMIAGELGDAPARASGMSTVNRPRDADGGQDGHQRAGGHDGEQLGRGERANQIVVPKLAWIGSGLRLP